MVLGEIGGAWKHHNINNNKESKKKYKIIIIMITIIVLIILWKHCVFLCVSCFFQFVLLSDGYGYRLTEILYIKNNMGANVAKVKQTG